MKTGLAIGLVLAAAARGELLDTFDASAGSPFSSGAAPAPAIQASGGFNAPFLRLVYDGVNGQVNRWTYPLTDAGAFDVVTAEFDFRGFDAAGNQAADGFSFMLIPTATFGTSGDGVNVQAEEPNAAGVFGLGFDFHPADGGANDMSAHWDGFEQVNHRAPTNAVNLDSGAFHHAHLTIRRVGNSSVAKLTVTPDVDATPGTPYDAFEQILPMMIPFESRVELAGRTGGRDMDVDLDNLHVTHSNLFAGLLSVATNRLFQDFDSADASRFVAAQHSGSAVGLFRPGVVPRTDGDPRGVYARLLHDGINTIRNSIAFQQHGPSLGVSQKLSVDFRLASAGGTADGLGFLFLPTSAYGTQGAGPDLATFEEPNLANTLAVGMDLYPNVNDLSVHFNGTERTNVTVNPADVDLNSGLWHRAEIYAEHVAGGMNVSVDVTPDVDGTPGPVVHAIVNQFVAGLKPYEWRVQIGGRTGGQYMNADVDNIIAGQGAKDTNLAWTVQNFDGGQTFYETWKQSAGTPYRTEILTDGATNGNFLRLVSAGHINSHNSVALDRTPDAALPAAGMTTIAEFDFRATENAENGDPADGIGFLLIPTATYGATGPGATHVTGHFDAEEPNIAGVLGVGIDLYQESAGVNDVSIHWDGAEQSNVTLDPVSQVDLDTAVFHHAKLLVNWGSGASTATLVITPDAYGAPGTPVVAISNLTVTGLEGFDYRIEAAARTGGATCSADLDGIAARTVPQNSYEAWIANAHSLLPAARGIAADPDGDGVANLLEYFSALDATTAGPGFWTSVDSAGGARRFTFRRSTNIPDLTYSYEWSADLAAWNAPDGTHIFTEQNLGGDATHDLIRTTLATPDTNAFVRVRIQKN